MNHELFWWRAVALAGPVGAGTGVVAVKAPLHVDQDYLGWVDIALAARDHPVGAFLPTLPLLLNMLQKLSVQKPLDTNQRLQARQAFLNHTLEIA